jgi:alkylation response protein AidB-like acyl-CoA dehydrogenase
MSKPVVHKPFGSQVPFCEPAWYQGQYTPYFHQGHVAYRQKVRDFVEVEIMPNIDEWIKTGYPRSLHTKAFQLGVTSIFAPTEYGGTKTKDIDAFYELIYVDEMARATGHVMGQIAIDSMALPPIIRFGSDFLKQKVCRPVFSGEKSIC